MNTHPLKYFSPEILHHISCAKTFEELLDTALFVLKKMPPSIGMVCGPITTGGAGGIKANLARFRRAIDMLTEKGENIFTQMPFEDPMQIIKEDAKYYKGGNHLLEVFYRELFRSGFVKRLYFLPDWKSSTGARWEHEQGAQLGLDLIELLLDDELREKDVFSPTEFNFVPA